MCLYYFKGEKTKDLLLRKSVAGFIFCVMLGGVLIPSITGNPLRTEDQDTTESLRYTFSFPQPSISTIKTTDATFSVIDMPGCIRLGRQPGDPTLPVKFIQLLLPPQGTVDSVTVTGSPVELRFSDTDLTRDCIYPAQEEVPIDTIAPRNFILNEEVYDSHQLYPQLPYSDYHIGYAHGYTILDIGLQPVQLVPAEGRIFYYPELTVTITLQNNETLNPFFRGTPQDEAWVKSLVCNPEVTTSYANLPRLEYPGGLCDPSDDYDYVIITTEANSLDYWETSEETPYNWESLMQKHMSEGLSSTLVTKQAIDACPDYYNANPLFNDSQAHIREFCRDAYEDWGIQYVLIGADAEFIAARLMDYGYENDVDADIYWSNLDNTFNADQDSYWGEEGDSGFDLYSELFIGRIPCDVPQDVSNWLSKSFYYANTTSTDYLENGGFFAGSIDWPPGNDGFDTLIDFAAINGTDHWYGSDPGQWPGFLGFLYGFQTWTVIHPDSAFNLSVRWTSGYPPNPGWISGDAISGFRNAVNNDSVTLITGIGHADNQMSLDVYASDWEILYHNTKPFFICDLGSHCGDFNSGDGVLDSMLFHSDTTLAFGCLYNTGYGWAQFDSTNSSEALQTKLFWDYFFDLANNSLSTDNWQLGKGLAWSKDVMAPTLTWGLTWRGTLQDRLLFADPAQLLQPPNPINLNNPPGIPTISWTPDIGLTIMATDPEGDDIFYMVDWGDGSTSEWLGPYHSGKEVTAMHTWVLPGTYMVRVRAKDIHDAISDWSDPLLVEILEPSLTIESIQGLYGIKITMKNTGNENLSVIGWNISLDGGLILLGKYRIGLVYSLPIEESETVHTFVLGFGKTTITVNAFSAQGATAEKTVNGFVLGVFVFGLK